MCAIESARRQTVANWEMIVVGDACTDDTAAVVQRLGDRRIKFVNLSRNTGEQSGPNNVGVAEARGSLIAFLNHDDLWFEDHLLLTRERLRASGADLVFSTAACISPASARPLRCDGVHVVLVGLAATGRYCPDGRDASLALASGWLVRRDALERLRGWRPARECTVEPSQELLFRAWRAGFRLRALNLVTLVSISSGTRPGSYVGDDATEQEWVLEQLGTPGFVNELVARAPESNAAAARRMRSRSSWLRRVGAAALARSGINPRAVAFRIKRGFGRGEYIRHLRTLRGLPDLGPDGTGPALRAEHARRSCVVAPGQTVWFRAGAGGARFLASGWSYPDDVGVWNDGDAAELILDLCAFPDGDVRVGMELEPLATVDGSLRRCEVAVGGSRLTTWLLDPAQPGRRSVVVPRPAARGSTLLSQLRFPETESPRARGLSQDRRELAARLLSARFDCENPRR